MGEHALQLNEKLGYRIKDINGKDMHPESKDTQTLKQLQLRSGRFVYSLNQ